MKRGFLNQKLGKRMSRKANLNRAKIEAGRNKPAPTLKKPAPAGLR